MNAIGGKSKSEKTRLNVPITHTLGLSFTNCSLELFTTRLHCKIALNPAKNTHPPGTEEASFRSPSELPVDEPDAVLSGLPEYTHRKS